MHVTFLSNCALSLYSHFFIPGWRLQIEFLNITAILIYTIFQRHHSVMVGSLGIKAAEILLLHIWSWHSLLEVHRFMCVPLLENCALRVRSCLVSSRSEAAPFDFINKICSKSSIPVIEPHEDFPDIVSL